MKKFALIGLVCSLVLAGCAQTTTTTTTTTDTPKDMKAFAQCLTDNGATMYGSKTCPHCMQQKANFGDSFKQISYVECTEEPTKCADLTAVPTWKFKDNTTLVGVQTFTTLGQKTNCPLK